MSGLNPFICFTVCLISSILCDWTFYTQRERECVQKPESNESNTENSIARLINQADACVCVCMSDARDLNYTHLHRL